MKKRFSLQKKQITVCIIAFAAALVTAFFVAAPYSRFILVSILLASYIFILVFSTNESKYPDKAARALEKFYEKQDKYVNSQLIPTAITDGNNIVLESNAAFFCMCDSKCIGEDITQVIPDISDKDLKHAKINEKEYKKEYSEVLYDGEIFRVYSFVDEEKITETNDLYKTVLGVVAIIQTDNYDDLLRSIPKSEHSSVEMQIENIIAAEADNVSGMYQQFAPDKYLMVFERKKLAVFMENKFDILRRVKRIDNTNGVKPTLSIGVGVRSTVKDSMDSATSALEMALSRGGDQAVIKDRQGYKFYGGGQQAPEIRVRVRARMFAKKLRELMEQSGNIIVTGHVVPDLDSMGAALGLCACAAYLDKKANIILDKPNAAIDELIAEMNGDINYSGLLITPQEAEKIIGENTLFIIVDTQIASHTLGANLLDRVKKLVIIDHHLRGTSYIEDSLMLYHEPYASSASEMVCEVVQYFSEHLHLKPLEAEALLAGITIDTKGFSFKSGARTFEAAAYLKKSGADTTAIRHLFQDDLETYSNRARVVQGATLVRDGIAFAECPKNAVHPQLLAAQSADALLSIRGIKASFVFSRSDKETFISGRSFGQINVQRILEKLGGGGHSTMAGAQLAEGLEKSKKMLLTAIDEYTKEG